ncbi:phage tail protein [Dulcicalothrix desertica PCC 7102]|uniref:Phage tail protein n=1 Tax=Dulcicalothrix desertica PCC 7102 TaxID=232991 RepID=A0A433V5S5_9CYAN|nr:phage tail protein [Dulcicalothrix desertica]RUT01463.1 phage tail protein [Dulcicalothrix desertica PCC 7102]TWH43500.1 phage tail-like protein [Dulcicalothrix desertica PCC 7102]
MPGQDYIECSSFTFSAGSKIKDLPVKEFSNMGMDAPPTDHVAGSGKNGEKTMQPRPTPVKPQNPTIVLAGCKDKSAYTWFNKVNPPTGKNPDWKGQLEDAKITAYADGKAVMEWQIKQCYPCKYSVSSMTSSGGELICETIELVAQEVTREQ